MIMYHAPFLISIERFLRCLLKSTRCVWGIKFLLYRKLWFLDVEIENFLRSEIEKIE